MYKKDRRPSTARRVLVLVRMGAKLVVSPILVASITAQAMILLEYLPLPNLKAKGAFFFIVFF